MQAQEATFDFLFDLPDPVADGSTPVQRGRCVTPNGLSIAIQTNQESGTFDGGIGVFAGQRSDQFFLDVRMVEKTALTGKLAFKQVGSDTLFGTNVLSIVLEIEWPKWLTGGRSPGS